MSSGNVHSYQTFLYQKTGWKLLFNSAGVLTSAVLVVVIIAASLFLSPQGNFLSGPNVNNIGQNWDLHAMLVPATILIIAAGGIDLSIAAVIAAVALLVASLTPVIGLTLSAIIGMVMALIIGLINGLLVGATRLNGVIVTLGVAVLLRGLVTLITQGKAVLFSDPGFLAAPSFPWIGLVVALVLGIPLIIVCQMRKAVHRSDEDERWGTRLFYVASPYILSGFMAGLAGLIFLVRIRAAMPTLGNGFEIDALLIAILGGTPLANLRINNGLINLIGSLIAALALVMLQNMLLLINAQIALIDVIKGILLVISISISTLYYFLVGRIGSRNQVEMVQPIPGEAQVYG